PHALPPNPVSAHVMESVPLLATLTALLLDVDMTAPDDECSLTCMALAAVPAACRYTAVIGDGVLVVTKPFGAVGASTVASPCRVKVVDAQFDHRPFRSLWRT